MGYKVLGFLVWQGGKWYLRRRMKFRPARPRPSMRRKLALAGLAALLIGAALAAQRRAASH